MLLEHSAGSICWVRQLAGEYVRQGPVLFDIKRLSSHLLYKEEDRFYLLLNPSCIVCAQRVMQLLVFPRENREVEHAFVTLALLCVAR